MQAALNVHVECNWVALHKSGCMHFAWNEMRFIEYHIIDLGRLGFMIGIDYYLAIGNFSRFISTIHLGSNDCSSLIYGV